MSLKDLLYIDEKIRSCDSKKRVDTYIDSMRVTFSRLSKRDQISALHRVCPVSEAILLKRWNSSWHERIGRPIDAAFVLGAPTHGGFNEESSGGAFRQSERSLLNSTPSLVHFKEREHAVPYFPKTRKNVSRIADVMRFHPQLNASQLAELCDARLNVNDSSVTLTRGEQVLSAMRVRRNPDAFLRNFYTSRMGIAMGIPDPRGSKVCKSITVSILRYESEKALAILFCGLFEMYCGSETRAIFLSLHENSLEREAVFASKHFGFLRGVMLRGGSELKSHFSSNVIFYAPDVDLKFWMMRPTPIKHQVSEYLAYCMSELLDP